MTDPASLLGPARARAARGDIAVHDHVCGMYESRGEQHRAACRFLAAGLARHEQCMYIVEHDTPAEFRAILASLGLDVKEAMTKGTLQIMSGEEVRLTLGGFTPDSMLAFLALAAKKARAGGFTAFRWGADMTWLRKDGIDPVDFFTFEAKLTPHLLKHDLVGLCQYGMRDFRADLLIAAAETHPLLVYDDLVCDNFYYIPPEEFLKPRFEDAKLKRILGNIITRERLMQSFLSAEGPGLSGGAAARS